MAEKNKYSEEQLIELLKTRDQSAFVHLYDNYSGALYNIIYRMLENHELCEDILQEAFVKIWNNFSSYNPSKERLFTWMLNITRNLTIDTIRSKSYRKQSKIQNPENASEDPNHPANEAFNQKQIIDLAYFEGLSQDEISKKLAIPLSTVKTNMRSAIMELRKLLHD